MLRFAKKPSHATGRRARAIQAQTKVMPSPEGGLNARDSLDDMPETDAIQLDNWFPGLGKTTMRRGFVEYATGMGSGFVETLASYQAGSQSEMLAAAGGKIFDASATGAATELATGFASNKWCTANFDGSMGLVNGVSAPQVYNGTTVAAMVVSGAGLTVANLVGITVFKNRTIFWENTGSDFWYSALSTLGGVLTRFPLSQVTGAGGYLANVVTWTRDGGDGQDDLIVFVMSTGAALVYSGTDPSSNFAIVGVFQIGPPVGGTRSALKVGGDAVVITRDGYMPLSKALPAGRVSSGYTIGDKIITDALERIRAAGSDFGWQVCHYPEGRYLLVNHPTDSVGVYNQHVVNLETGAWCRFVGQSGACWVNHGNRLYFGGGAGIVYLADEGATDNGMDIVAEGRQAFTSCNRAGTRKTLEAVRMLMESDAEIPLELEVDVDFSSGNVYPNPVTVGEGDGSSDWDEADWDDASWGDENRPKIGTFVRGRVGDAFGLRVRIATQGQSISWNRATLMWRPIAPT